MKKINLKSLLSYSALCFFAGCASKGGSVQERAAFDLNCPVAQVTVKELPGAGWGAQGCGQRASYTCNRDGWGGVRCYKNSENTKN